MYCTCILRSLSHPEQRYNGSTGDLHARFAKTSEVKRSVRRMPSIAILRSFNVGGSSCDGGLTALHKDKPMFYTYILRSLLHPDQRYIGSTGDLHFSPV